MTKKGAADYNVPLQFVHAVDDLETLIGASSELEKAHGQEAEQWRNSPFAWVRMLPSRTSGAVGEQLVEAWLRTFGFDVARPSSHEHDRVVNGTPCEIKFSTLWENGRYSFQQIRDQHYHIAIFLGVSPHDAHCWVIPKLELIRQWHDQDGALSSQHGGSRGVDTAWFQVDPRQPPDWITQWGGHLSDARDALVRLLDQEPVW